MKTILYQLRIAFKDQLGYAINIFSLAIGFLVCLLVFRFVQSELTYDTHHPNFENIYRLTLDREVNGAEVGDAVIQISFNSANENGLSFH